MMKTLVCLSSGMTPQYRLDVLSLMALPTGTEIQFRYDVVLIDSEIRGGLGQNALQDSSVLLAYVDCDPEDQSDGSRPIIPCRQAKLIGSTQLGQYFILRFELQSFADCRNSSALARVLAAKSPRRTAGQLQGMWAFSADFQALCGASDKIEVWQDIIKSLAGHKDFASERFFFTVTGIYPRGKGGALVPERGEFRLQSNSEYELRIFHFHPDSDAHGARSLSTVLKVVPGTNEIRAVTTPSLAIDSSYDLKSFHFRTHSPTTTDHTAFTVRFEGPAGEPDKPTEPGRQPELFLPVTVSPSILRLGISLVALTLLLFGQQWIAATAKGAISQQTTSILCLLALFTAWVVVFGLKKPL